MADEVSHASEDAEPRFPVFSTIGDVQVATIPMIEYADLLNCRKQVDEIRERARRYAVPSRSPIETDEEVAAFFMERFGRVPMDTILRDAQKRFGIGRTPSRTSAYAYWQRLRLRAAGVQADPPVVNSKRKRIRRGLGRTG